MIPITEIHPMLVHFPIVLWIGTEAIAVVVLLHGGDLSVRQQWPAVALYSLLAGITGLLVTAYLGGELVYHVRSMWRRWFADRFGGAPHHRHSGIGGALVTQSL
jgi:uncharacterized membrane protein